MSETPKLEYKEFRSTPRPNLLDVVKIDGRYAQVIAGGGFVRYLDDKSEIPINWDEYDCQFFDKYQKGGCTNIWVRDLVEEGLISKKEYETIVWDSITGPANDPNKRFVTVFGVYTRKSENKE